MDAKKARPVVLLANESMFQGRRRPGSRTITATTSMYDSRTISRVGLTIDDAIDEELADFRRGRDDAAARGIDGYAYGEGQPDLTLWEGDRCLAVIRHRLGGEPEVIKLGDLGQDNTYVFPGRRPFGGWTIMATVSMWDFWPISRDGLTVDDAIAEQLDDAKAYPNDPRDVALWEGERCLAVIRHRVGGNPQVIKLGVLGSES